MTHFTYSSSDRPNKFLVIHILMCLVKYNELIKCPAINFHHTRKDVEHYHKQSKSFVLFNKLIAKVNNYQTSGFQVLLKLVAICNVLLSKIQFLFSH